MFDYTKQLRDFSIFHNNVAIENVPFIKKNYILFYTTKSNGTKYAFSREEILDCVEAMNDRALDSEHFHLLSTHYFKSHLISALKE